MSKGLAALERLKNNKLILLGYSECLSTIEKELKALKVIKDKGVNVAYLVHRLKTNNLEYKTYTEEQNTKYLDVYVSQKMLTEEEFDLLREVLL